ncbi:MAG: hypothetical protein KKA84_10415 [Bacteroidetes bacterium]|nr:hypothetical protein [Bacteroidota bacterium]
MAEKLLQIYKCMAEKSGIQGKMELAKMTKVPSTKASLEPDSAENINMFREAFKKITGEFPSVR